MENMSELTRNFVWRYDFFKDIENKLPNSKNSLKYNTQITIIQISQRNKIQGRF